MVLESSLLLLLQLLPRYMESCNEGLYCRRELQTKEPIAEDMGLDVAVVVVVVVVVAVFLLEDD